VFDGVGGRGNGRLASHCAAQTIHDGWKQLSVSAHTAEQEQLQSMLQDLIQQAHQRVLLVLQEQTALPEKQTSQKQPATTAAIAVLSHGIAEAGSFMTYAHVGDSRIYLLRGQQPLQRLTVDDGYFPFALQKGWLKEEDLLRIEQATSSTDLSETDLKHFDRRNKITRALGWEDFQVAHTDTIDLVSDDRILLCTDGIHDNLTDHEIEEILRKESIATSTQQLVQIAYQRSQEQQRRSKQDDMSAVVILYQAPC
jgi:protein phosphatase